jgi:uncharacterized membrane protein YozB (DUF420 family)
MTELLHSKGFLGTNANFAADMTLVLGIVVAILFTVGLLLARMQKYTAHRWVQTTAASLNLILVVWLMLLPFRDFVLRDSGGPRPSIFYVVPSIHMTIGAVALIYGLFVVLRGNGLMIKSLRFRNYKVFMRIAYSLYMAATLAGCAVYYTWFVVVPNAPIFK